MAGRAHETKGIPRWVDGLILVIVVAVAVVAIGYYVQAGTFGSSLADDQNVSWHMVRSAGLTAYILLGASTLWGVFLATRAIKDWSPGPVSLLLHASASWLAVVLGFAHAGLLLFDRYYQYKLSDLLVPFTGPYRPLAVGLGTLSLWFALAITISFSLRKLLGQRNWRLLHYTSYVTFLLVTVHALLAGTDGNNLGMRLIAGFFVVGMLGTVALRLLRNLLKPAAPKAQAQAGQPVTRARRSQPTPSAEA